MSCIVVDNVSFQLIISPLHTRTASPCLCPATATAQCGCCAASTCSEGSTYRQLSIRCWTRGSYLCYHHHSLYSCLRLLVEHCVQYTRDRVCKLCELIFTIASWCLFNRFRVNEFQAGCHFYYLNVTIINKVIIMLYLLSTTSEFMALNLRGRGRSPEAKDGLRIDTVIYSIYGLRLP